MSKSWKTRFVSGMLVISISSTAFAQNPSCEKVYQTPLQASRTEVFINKSKAVAKGFLRGSVQVLSPVPLSLPFRENASALNEQFIAKLSRYGRNYMNLVVGLNFLVMGSLTAYTNSRVQTADEYFRAPISTAATKSGSEKRVDVLLEVTQIAGPVAFPHIAIKIDQRIYSYGVSHLTGELAAQHKWNLENSNVNSLQYVSLKIPADQVLEMKRELESNIGKRYANVTYINDCSTMVSRTLNKYGGFQIPKVVDASPSALMSYMMGLKISGSQKVLGFGSVMVNKNQSPLQASAQNAYVNIMDGKFWYLGLPTNYILRGYFDLKITDSKRQYFETDTIKAIDEFKVEILKDVETSIEMAYLKQQLEAVTSPQEKKKQIQESISELEQPSLEIIQNKEASGQDLLRAKLTIEVLETLKTDLISNSLRIINEE
jgi:hypothetical protein